MMPNAATNMNDVFSQFAEALASHGLIVKGAIIADGNTHRCPTRDRPHSKNGAYVLHPNPPRGQIWDWAKGGRNPIATWRPEGSAKHISEVDRERRDLDRREREIKAETERKEAQKRLRQKWDSAQPANANHPYLVRKRVGAYGLKQDNGELLIPLHSASGKLTAIQRIFWDSKGGKFEKRFVTGSRPSGSYFLIGGPDIQSETVVAEGYATGASVFEATGITTLVAFSAGNLVDVATGLRKLRPNDAIIICADNDEKTDGNPGVTKATEAAKSANALLAIPPKSGDYNDLMISQGKEAVKMSISNAKTVSEIRLVEPKPTTDKSKSLTVCMADVEPEEVHWLWQDRIPLGKITLLDGDPGLGKSTVAIDIAARLTRGATMPYSDLHIEPAGVILLCPEDGLADTIRPRLGVAKAEVSLVHAFTDLLTVPGDLGKIEQEIKRVNARLVVLDPLSAHLGKDTNSYRDQDVRRALAPLAQMAERANVAVLVIRHLTKSNGVSPMYRGGGSIGIVGASRSAILVAKSPDNEDERIAAVYKSNLAPSSPALRYKMVSAGAVPRIEWLGETDITAESLLDAAADAAEHLPSKGKARSDAKEFLEEILANGPVEATSVLEKAKDKDIKERTLKRAKSDIGVQSFRQCEGDPSSPWLWHLASWHPGEKQAKNTVKSPQCHNATMPRDIEWQSDEGGDLV